MLLKRKFLNMYTCELTKDMETLYNYKDVYLMKIGVSTYNILSNGTYIGRLFVARNIIYQFSELPSGIISKYMGKKIETEDQHISLTNVKHDPNSGIKTAKLINTRYVSIDDDTLINKVLNSIGTDSSISEAAMYDGDPISIGNIMKETEFAPITMGEFMNKIYPTIILHNPIKEIGLIFYSSVLLEDLIRQFGGDYRIIKSLEPDTYTLYDADVMYPGLINDDTMIIFSHVYAGKSGYPVFDIIVKDDTIVEIKCVRQAQHLHSDIVRYLKTKYIEYKLKEINDNKSKNIKLKIVEKFKKHVEYSSDFLDDFNRKFERNYKLYSVDNNIMILSDADRVRVVDMLNVGYVVLNDDCSEGGYLPTDTFYMTLEDNKITKLSKYEGTISSDIQKIMVMYLKDYIGCNVTIDDNIPIKRTKHTNYYQFDCSVLDKINSESNLNFKIVGLGQGTTLYLFDANKVEPVLLNNRTFHFIKKRDTFNEIKPDDGNYFIIPLKGGVLEKVYMLNKRDIIDAECHSMVCYIKEMFIGKDYSKIGFRPHKIELFRHYSDCDLKSELDSIIESAKNLGTISKCPWITASQKKNDKILCLQDISISDDDKTYMSKNPNLYFKNVINDNTFEVYCKLDDNYKMGIIVLSKDRSKVQSISAFKGRWVNEMDSLINIGIEFLNHKPNVPIYWNADYKLFEIKVNDKMVYAYNLDNFNMVILDDPNIELRDATGATGRIRFLYDQIVDTIEIYQSSIHNEYKEDIFSYLIGTRLLFERKESYPEFCLGKTLDSLLVSRKTSKLISRLFRIPITVITGHEIPENKIISLTKIDNNKYKVEGFDSNELFLNKTSGDWEYFDTTISDKPVLQIITENMIIKGIIITEPGYNKSFKAINGYKFDIAKPKEIYIKKTDIPDAYKLVSDNGGRDLILLKTGDSTLYSIYNGTKMTDYLLGSAYVNDDNVIESILKTNNINMFPVYIPILESLRWSKIKITDNVEGCHDYNWLLTSIDTIENRNVKFARKAWCDTKVITYSSIYNIIRVQPGKNLGFTRVLGTLKYTPTEEDCYANDWYRVN